jgi:hypothetical protein
MDIKNVKGNLSTEEFIKELLPAARIGTLGELWEDKVDCNHCKFRDTCKELCDKVDEEYGVNLYCNQVIEILLGNLDPENIESLEA